METTNCNRFTGDDLLWLLVYRERFDSYLNVKLSSNLVKDKVSAKSLLKTVAATLIVLWHTAPET